MLRALELRLTFFLACILFRLILDVSYILFVHPVFGYSGFEYDFSIFAYALSWLIYFLSVVITPHLLSKVSDFFLATFSVTILAPLTSIVGLSGTGWFPLIVAFLVFVFLRIFQYGTPFAKALLVPRIIKIAEGRFISVILSILAVSVLVLWYFYSGAVQYFNLNLLKVYDFREESAELASIGIMGYFNGWVYKVFSIFLMCYFLWKGRLIYFSLFLIVQVFFFGVSAHKGVLFYPVMILAIWFYFRKTRAIAVMPIGLSIIVSLGLLLYLTVDHMMMGSLFIRRVLFVPAMLTLDYFQFFSVNEFVWWSNSILEGVHPYPYGLSVGEEIGLFNGSGSSANNGFVSSGYAHAGLIGVAVYTFILAYFLKVLDSVVLNSDVPVWLALGMTIVPLRSALVSSDLFTTMLTHGLALSLLLLLLFRRSRFCFRPEGNRLKYA
jgi:hypothetical protein